MESLCAATLLDLLLYRAAGRDQGCDLGGLAGRDDSVGLWCRWSRPPTGCMAVWPLLPDTDPSCRFEPQLVGSADVKRAVELVEVPHDLVATELAG